MKLGAKVIDGAFWNTSMALFNKLVTLLGQIALAWLLVPADMGLAGLAQAAAAILLVVSIGGIGDVLLQRKSYDEESGQALWLALVCGLLMGLAIMGLAGLAPKLRRPHMRGLLLVLAFSTAVGSPVPVLLAGLKHNLDFKGLAVAQMLGGCAYTILAVVFAIMGWGAYALVVPLVFQQIVIMLVSLRCSIRMVWESPKWNIIRSLLRPTLSLSASSFLLGIESQAAILVCSYFLSSTALGHFGWGWNVAGQTVFLLGLNLKNILLPAIVKMESEIRAWQVLKMARVISGVLCLACGVQALLAHFVITTFLPVKWAPAVPVVVAASLGMTAQGFLIGGQAWMNAGGKYRTMLLVSSLQLFFTVVCTWIGVAHGGLIGAAVGSAVANMVGAIINIFPIGHKILLKTLKSWMMPALVTPILWLLCWMDMKDSAASSVLFSGVFFLLAAWAWWRADDGGFGMIVKRVAELLHERGLSLVRTRN